jgi:hypothetical protein
MRYRKPVPGDKIAEAKQLYENTLVPVKDIAALLGLSRNTLQRRAVEWGWKMRTQGSLDLPRLRPDRSGRPRAVPQAPPREGSGTVPTAPAERIALTERIQAVAEQEIAAVEQIIAILGDTHPGDTEAAARTLASLARTLRELVQLDVPVSGPDAKHDQPIPRTVDELRRSLAEKLEALVAEAADPVPGET